MSITLRNAGTTLTLPEDLFWSDEYAWTPVEQTATRTITGANVLSAELRVAGRPITLGPQGDDSAWMTREMLEVLRNWAAVPLLEMELTLRGESRNVVFRHQDGGGLEAKPLVHFSEMDDSDNYLVTLRFMEI